MRRFGLAISIVGGGLISLIGISFAYYALPTLSADPDPLRSYKFAKPVLAKPLWEFFIPGLLLYATMLVGIVLSQLFQEVIAKPDEPVKPRDLIRSLSKGRSWAAILASPIVFFSTAPSLLALGPGTVAFFYALQNGFFCLAIFNAISAKFASPPPKAI